MYDELIAELRQHHCDAKEDDTQEVCEECCYDVIIVDKSAPSGFASVCACGLMNRAADAIEELQKRVPKSGVWREEESGYDDVYYECSVCGAGVCTIDGDPVDNAWSYCPECGAKMTGVERLPEPPKEETK